MADRKLLALLCCLFMRDIQAAAPFFLTTNSFVAVRNGGMAWGDYNNDGLLDLIVTGDDGRGITALYRNAGAGGFVRTNIRFPGFRGGVAHWIDFDNDGYLDLSLSGIIVSTEYNGFGSRMYRNLGGTAFTEFWRRDGDAFWIRAFGDVNNDGLIDLSIGNSI